MLLIVSGEALTSRSCRMGTYHGERLSAGPAPELILAAKSAPRESELGKCLGLSNWIDDGKINWSIIG